MLLPIVTWYFGSVPCRHVVFHADYMLYIHDLLCTYDDDIVEHNLLYIMYMTVGGFLPWHAFQEQVFQRNMQYLFYGNQDQPTQVSTVLRRIQSTLDDACLLMTLKQQPSSVAAIRVEQT